MTNLGASLGTALAGSLLIAAVSPRLPGQHPAEPGTSRPGEVGGQVKLGGGVPFISDADLEAALDEAGSPTRDRPTRRSTAYQDARIDGLKTALAILALLALVGLLYSGRIPRKQPQGGGRPADEEDDP